MLLASSRDKKIKIKERVASNKVRSYFLRDNVRATKLTIISQANYPSSAFDRRQR
jgi:hypothetical protein